MGNRARPATGVEAEGLGAITELPVAVGAPTPNRAVGLDCTGVGAPPPAARISDISSINTGTSVLVSSPMLSGSSISCPSSLLPQQYSSPASVSAQVCCVPWTSDRIGSSIASATDLLWCELHRAGPVTELAQIVAAPTLHFAVDQRTAVGQPATRSWTGAPKSTSCGVAGGTLIGGVARELALAVGSPAVDDVHLGQGHRCARRRGQSAGSCPVPRYPPVQARQRRRSATRCASPARGLAAVGVCTHVVTPHAEGHDRVHPGDPCRQRGGTHQHQVHLARTRRPPSRASSHPLGDTARVPCRELERRGAGPEGGRELGGDRRETGIARGETQLAQVVGPPAPDAPVHLDHTRVPLADGQLARTAAAGTGAEQVRVTHVAAAALLTPDPHTASHPWCRWSPRPYFPCRRDPLRRSCFRSTRPSTRFRRSDRRRPRRAPRAPCLRSAARTNRQHRGSCNNPRAGKRRFARRGRTRRRCRMRNHQDVHIPRRAWTCMRR